MEQTTIYYQLNATGNLLIKKTIPLETPLPAHVMWQFSNTYLYCAAMLKAIANTPHPSGQSNYSIYNQHALERIIQQSNQFLKLSSTEHVIHTDIVSDEFSHSLYQKLFDISLHKADIPLISNHIAQMGKEGMRMVKNASPEEYKTGFILFILEYINGVSNVTAKIIYFDVRAHRHQLKKTLCQRLFKCKSKWHIQTDYYSFAL